MTRSVGHDELNCTGGAHCLLPNSILHKYAGDADARSLIQNFNSVMKVK